MNLNLQVFSPMCAIRVPWSDEVVSVIDPNNLCGPLQGCQVTFDHRVGLILITKGEQVVAVPISLCVASGTVSTIVPSTVGGRRDH